MPPKISQRKPVVNTSDIKKDGLPEGVMTLKDSPAKGPPEDIQKLQKSSSDVQSSKESMAEETKEDIKKRQKGSNNRPPEEISDLDKTSDTIRESPKQLAKDEGRLEDSDRLREKSKHAPESIEKLKDTSKKGSPESIENLKNTSKRGSPESIEKLKDAEKKGSPESIRKLNESSGKPPSEIAKLKQNVLKPPQRLVDIPSKEDIAERAEGHSKNPPKTIAQLAESNALLNLPWVPQARPLSLGTLFHSRLCNTTDPWSRQSPFDPEYLKSLSAVYRNDDGGVASFQILETTSSNTSDEHLSVAFGITVGCSFLNASVTGGYDKDTLENNDARKLSIKASFRAGSIVLEHKPQLSLDALVILKHQGGLPAFKALYGDYYIAGYRLGGDAAVLLSETSMTMAKVERLSVKVAVKVLFVTASKTHEKFFRSAGAESGFRVSGFDTLDQKLYPLQDPVSVYSSTPTGGVALEEMARTAKDMELRCVQLPQRVTDKVEELKLKQGQEISQDALENLLSDHVVVEMILLPITSLRQVQEWSRSTDVIGF